MSNYNIYMRQHIPVGIVLPFCTDILPTEFLECDGSTLPISGYGNLHGVIGNRYGGDGVTTLALPDYRNYFLRGVSGVSTNDPDKLTRLDRGDGTGGNIVGSKQMDDFASHSHEFSYWVNTITGGYANTQIPPRPLQHSNLGGSSSQTVNNISDMNYPGGQFTDSSPVGETRPDNVRVLYAMKVI